MVSHIGPHMVDYKARSIQFFDNTQFITFNGIPNISPMAASLHQLHRLCTSKSIAECFSLSVQEPAHTSHSQVPSNSSKLMVDNVLDLPLDMPELLKQLLCKYQIVFSVPVGLPPQRAFDNHIPLPADDPQSKLDLTIILLAKNLNLKPWFHRCFRKA